MTARFRDRHEAGRVLASSLERYRGDDVVVLALPRGGVPVGFEVAERLGARLDVFVVRKLGVPGHEELAFGAIAPNGQLVVDRAIVSAVGLRDEQIRSVASRELREIERREQAYRGGRPPPDVAGRTVILVDDGLATGSTMRVAVSALRRSSPSRIVAAVPIAPPETCASMGEIADDVVCARTPEPFRAVGLWYDDFSQTTDDEVRELLGVVADERSQASRAVRAGTH